MIPVRGAGEVKGAPDVEGALGLRRSLILGTFDGEAEPSIWFGPATAPARGDADDIPTFEASTAEGAEKGETGRG